MLINAKEKIVTYKDVNIFVKDITLLSIEEYKQYRNIIPRKYFWWWLRSFSDIPTYAASVSSEGSLSLCHVSISSPCVRPVLICEQTNLDAGVEISFADKDWTVLNESIILCNSSIGNCAFRKERDACDSNIYEASDVKKFIQDWKTKEVANNG